jgi:hypothetical protein
MEKSITNNKRYFGIIGKVIIIADGDTLILQKFNFQFILQGNSTNG